jgi:transposase
MDARELRGMQIAATMPLRKSAEGWIVPSQSNRGNYRVWTANPRVAALDPSEGLACTCPDFELRGLACKHVIAVEYTMRRLTVTEDGEIVAEEVKVTYSQDWTAYNAAQTAEKDHFFPMLRDLCATIPQPPQGKGRPRLPMSDMAFEAVAKVYSGLSARRFDSDVRENAAKGHTAQDPHFNSVLRYLRDPAMTPALTALVELSALPLKGVESDFAADSTGFTTSRFVRWYDHKWGKDVQKREWVKLHAMTGVRTNIVTAVEISGWRSHDTNYFRPLLATTATNGFALREVSADKAYSSKANLRAVDAAGATPFIPFKGVPAMPGATLFGYEAAPATGDIWRRMYHLFAFQRDTFLSRYHHRSNVETTFSMIKAKFGDSLRSKSDTGQINEVLAKVVAHNLCVLIACMYELGLAAPAFSHPA